MKNSASAVAMGLLVLCSVLQTSATSLRRSGVRRDGLDGEDTKSQAAHFGGGARHLGGGARKVPFLTGDAKDIAAQDMEMAMKKAKELTEKKHQEEAAADEAKANKPLVRLNNKKKNGVHKPGRDPTLPKHDCGEWEEFYEDMEPVDREAIKEGAMPDPHGCYNVTATAKQDSDGSSDDDSDDSDDPPWVAYAKQQKRQKAEIKREHRQCHGDEDDAGCDHGDPEDDAPADDGDSSKTYDPCDPAHIVDPDAFLQSGSTKPKVDCSEQDWKKRLHAAKNGQTTTSAPTPAAGNPDDVMSAEFGAESKPPPAAATDPPPPAAAMGSESQPPPPAAAMGGESPPPPPEAAGMPPSGPDSEGSPDPSPSSTDTGSSLQHIYHMASDDAKMAAEQVSASEDKEKHEADFDALKDAVDGGM